MLARYGEQEFAILSPMIDMRETEALADRLRGLVEKHVWDHPSCGQLRVTVSLGVAAVPTLKIETAERLPVCADKAMHRAKANGGNCVKIYEAGLDDQTSSASA